MEPLIVLSSSVSETDFKKCVLYQTTEASEKLSESTSLGRQLSRKGLNDVKPTNKIESILSNQPLGQYQYHRICYPNFTNIYKPLPSFSTPPSKYQNLPRRDLSLGTFSIIVTQF